MQLLTSVLLSLSLLATGPCEALCAATEAADDAGFTVTATLPVGGDGRWDYVTTDAPGTRVFVPRSSHTQVLDAANGKLLADIPETAGVHGVALAPERNRGFTSNGKSGTVTVFDLTSYLVLGSVPAAADADCIIHDEATHQVLVFCGDAAEMVAIPDDVDPSKPVVPAPLALGSKPEYAVADGHGLVYVNLQEENQIAVIDAATRTIKSQYPVAPGVGPTGMSMDREHRRLFIGCHNQLLVIMDADTGAVIDHLPIGKGNDATAYRQGMAFASCGDGTLTVVRESSPSSFAVSQTIVTMPGARTMAVDPASGRILMPFAKQGPTPDPTPDHPHSRPPLIPGSFALLVVSPPGAAPAEKPVAPTTP